MSLYTENEARTKLCVRSRFRQRRKAIRCVKPPRKRCHVAPAHLPGPDDRVEHGEPRLRNPRPEALAGRRLTEHVAEFPGPTLR
jgi:hypothetical protein